MTTPYIRFMNDSRAKALDTVHFETIDHNISKYSEAFSRGKKQYSNLQLARRRAGMKKYHVIEHLEDHLKAFEHNFAANGGKVVWALDAAEARKAVIGILLQHQARVVVKSKSMVSEEIGLNEALSQQGIESIETDLGEYIFQLTGDKPYHIVTPIMHRSAKDVARIFHEKFGLSENAEPEDVVDFVRDHLRDAFRGADAGITGANFLISGSGSVALTENEGNGLLSVSMPRLHIVITGIEKIIASVEDLELFWPLLSTHGTGQHITAYNSLISGPRAKNEKDGPEHMYVVLLDNRRSRLLGTLPQRRSLSCIRCGACLNVCPVYRHIGGHAYGTVYSGPIGAVISPHLLGNLDQYKHLSFASTLCGKCTDVCPVGIDLHHQLLKNRRLSVSSRLTSRSERLLMWAYRYTMKKRSRLDRFSARTKNALMRRFFAKAWGPGRELPLADSMPAAKRLQK